MYGFLSRCVSWAALTSEALLRERRMPLTDSTIMPWTDVDLVRVRATRRLLHESSSDTVSFIVMAEKARRIVEDGVDRTALASSFFDIGAK